MGAEQGNLDVELEIPQYVMSISGCSSLNKAWTNEVDGLQVGMRQSPPAVRIRKP